MLTRYKSRIVIIDFISHVCVLDALHTSLSRRDLNRLTSIAIHEEQQLYNPQLYLRAFGIFLWCYTLITLPRFAHACARGNHIYCSYTWRRVHTRHKRALNVRGSHCIYTWMLYTANVHFLICFFISPHPGMVWMPIRVWTRIYTQYIDH